MRRILVTFAAALIAAGAAQPVSAQPAYAILHSFAGTPTDGSVPWGNLTTDGIKFYGMTLVGGPGDVGTAFSINVDGTGYIALHNFAGGATDGILPFGNLVSDGSTLYGITAYGGSGALGTAFSMNTDGSGFSILHSFAGGVADGTVPEGSPILVGSKLYGITAAGGPGPTPGGNGTVFSLNTDGTGFTILHGFAGPPADGSGPYGSLVSDGIKLYGVTLSGGSGPGVSGSGVVFSMNTNGTGYAILHNFAGSPGDGASSWGGLLLDGYTLYGMTLAGGAGWGGANFNGAIFSLHTDGSQFALLHSFTTGADDGAVPFGSLIIDHGTLYGMASTGGANNLGALFSIQPDGSDFAILHDFAGTPGDGSTPYGSLLSSGGSLYGMTSTGGTGGLGTVFSQPLPPPNYINLHVSPLWVSGGGAVTLSWECNFSEYGYEGVPVDVYLAAIKDPLVASDASSVDDALLGGAIYFFRSDMSLYPGPVQGPTWTGISFPPVAASGTLSLSLPPAPGDYVIATAFRYHGTTIYVRSDGKPVENSNLFTIR